MKPAPLCVLIAGPNGAGKTTFAREFLPREAGILHFVNADLSAAGLSPLKPALAAARHNFAFESTLAGVAYVNRLKRWNQPRQDT